MKRKICFDFVKGYLVLAMAVYHWMNYCLIGHAFVYNYVSYVSEGFIFFSGYLCGEVYYRRFINDKKSVIKRLVVRAAKMVFLFVLLNTITYTFFDGARGVGGNLSVYDLFVRHFSDVFIVGNDSLVAFEILLPIAYLLALCPVLFLLENNVYIIYASLVTFFLLVDIGYVYKPYNAIALLIGVGGVCTSLVIKKINLKRTHNLDILFVCMAIIYFFANIPFFHIHGILVKYFAINIVIVNLIIACHFMRNKWNASFIVAEFSLLGKFSLFLYLFQIFYLQIISSFFVERYKEINGKIIAVFFLLLIISSFMCRLIPFLRRKIALFDRLYAAIFQ